MVIIRIRVREHPKIQLRYLRMNPELMNILKGIPLKKYKEQEEEKEGIKRLK